MGNALEIKRFFYANLQHNYVIESICILRNFAKFLN